MPSILCYDFTSRSKTLISNQDFNPCTQELMEWVKLSDIGPNNQVINSPLLLVQRGFVSLVHRWNDAVVSSDFAVIPCLRLNRHVPFINNAGQLWINNL